MNADKGKAKTRAKASFTTRYARGTEDTEEKQEKTFKDWALGLNPKNRFLILGFHLCPSACICGKKKVMDFERSGWRDKVLVFIDRPIR
jgi:hypothetical protein